MLARTSANFFQKLTVSPVRVWVFTCSTIFAIGFVDSITGKDISLGILYVIPIALATWFCGFTCALVLSILSVVVWLIADHISGTTFPDQLTQYWNGLVRCGFFLAISFLVARVRELTEHLEQEVQKRTASLQLEIVRRKRVEAEMVDLQQREHQRLAEELHDNIGSYLAGVAFRAKMLSDSLSAQNSPQAESCQQLVQLINTGMTKVRKVIRLLTPIEHTNEDLYSALSRISAEIETSFGISCLIEGGRDLPPIDSPTAEQLCRIAQEAIRNAIQHAHPDKVEVRLHSENGFIHLSIENDGSSWDPSDSSLRRGLGLRIMRHRCERIGGTLTITGGLQRRTCVTCVAPIKRPSAASSRPAAPVQPDTPDTPSPEYPELPARSQTPGSTPASKETEELYTSKDAACESR